MSIPQGTTFAKFVRVGLNYLISNFIEIQDKTIGKYLMCQKIYTLGRTNLFTMLRYFLLSFN